MFKKFINDAKKNIKSDLNNFINETKEEFDIRNKKELYQKIDDSKDSLKKHLQEEKLNGKDVGAIVDATLFSSIGGIGLDQGETKLFNNTADKLNNLISKMETAIPEESLFRDKTVENEKPLLPEDKINIVETTQSNKNEMISENLNSLIEFALVDGELTEKEKQILFKKAESEGIDLDEFEMILNAKLFQAKQIQTSPKPVENINVAPKSDKFGDIKKCPACGAIVESFSTRCGDCGTDFRNISANNTIERLFTTLESIEASRKSGIGSFLGATFGVSVSDVDKRKIETITSFPIPNTKEDILEFLIHSVPRVKFQHTPKFGGKVNYQNQPFNLNLFSMNVMDTIPNLYAETWRNKCHEIINKARLSMKEDKRTLNEIENYAKQIGL